MSFNPGKHAYPLKLEADFSTGGGAGAADGEPLKVLRLPSAGPLREGLDRRGGAVAPVSRGAALCARPKCFCLP